MTPPPPPGGRRRNSGCCCTGLVAVIAIVAIVVVASGSLTRQSTAWNKVSVNSSAEKAEKEKLTAEECIRTDEMMNDELGWLSDLNTVESAMEYFYNKTGVQPYLIICDKLDGKGGEITDEEAEAYLENQYDSLYEDEGHMIFAFMEYAESEYITFLYTGASADTVIDAEAREVFLNNADRYYTDSSLSDEEYFAQIFRSSADEIMNN